MTVRLEMNRICLSNLAEGDHQCDKGTSLTEKKICMRLKFGGHCDVIGQNCRLWTQKKVVEDQRF